MLKRIFDFCVALVSLMVLFPLLIIVWFIAYLDTNSSGVFTQDRIGQYGKSFVIYKLRSMHMKSGKISKWGAFVRRSKLDEFPQLFNVLIGTMSLVGPRPDVSGYYDKLIGEDRRILELKPGLTSAAAIKYVNEEELLAHKSNPLHYNDTVIFPDKVRMNLAYYNHHSFFGDLQIIWQTVLALFR